MAAGWLGGVQEGVFAPFLLPLENGLFAGERQGIPKIRNAVQARGARGKPLSCLRRPRMACCGSAIAAKRPSGLLAVFASLRPPSRSARTTACSVFSTLKYGVQPGLTSRPETSCWRIAPLRRPALLIVV